MSTLPCHSNTHTFTRASLSTVGRYEDQFGVIATVSEWLRERRANVTAVYSVKFGGNYGSHFLFEADEAAMKRVEAEWEPCLFREYGAHFQADFQSSPGNNKSLVFELTIKGFDREGILSEVSRSAASRNADILATSALACPPPNGPRAAFILQMKLAFGDSADAEALGGDIKLLAERNGWKVDFECLSG